MESNEAGKIIELIFIHCTINWFIDYRDRPKPNMIWPQNSPDPNLIRHLWDMQEQVQYMEAPSPNPRPKGPTATSLCHTPQDTPRSLVSITWWVRAVLVVQERFAEYKAGGFNVGADWCEVKPPYLFGNINYNYTAILLIFFWHICGNYIFV